MDDLYIVCRIVPSPSYPRHILDEMIFSADLSFDKPSRVSIMCISGRAVMSYDTFDMSLTASFFCLLSYERHFMLFVPSSLTNEIESYIERQCSESKDLQRTSGI